MKLSLILVSFSVLIISCLRDSNDNTVDPVKENFVKGELIIGIKDTASIQNVFALMNSKQFSIDEMFGFFYYSTGPSDSVNSIINFLLTKPYLNTRGFYPNQYSVYYYPPDNNIRVVCAFFNMNSINQTDWLNTIPQLNLTALRNSTKDMVIKVPVGSEKYWLEQLKTYDIIKWVALNEIIPIDFFLPH